MSNLFAKVSEVKEKEAAMVKKIAEDKLKDDKAKKSWLNVGKKNFESLIADLEKNSFIVKDIRIYAFDTGNKTYSISQKDNELARISYSYDSYEVTYDDEHRNIPVKGLRYYLNGASFEEFERFETELARILAKIT